MSTATLTTVAGVLDALEADLILPRAGVWGAHLELPDDLQISGAATLTIAGDNNGASASFVGTVRRALPWRGRTRVVLAGGAGGLMAPLEPREYLAGIKPVRPALVVAHVAAAAGEQLAAGVEDALAGSGLERWTRTAGRGVEALDVLADHFGWTWRILADGTLWVGVETWPVSAGDLGEVWSDDGDDGRIDCAPPVASLRPGETVITDAPRQLERVTYRVRAGSVRAELLYSVTGDAPPRAAPLVFREAHAGTVVLQNSDGTLELKMDDPRLPGLRSVRFKPGVVGARCTIAAGERVRVVFAEGDPSQPFAAALDMDDSASKGVVRVGDAGVGGSLSAVAGTTPVTFTYTDPDGIPTVGGHISLKTKATVGSEEVFLR